ncbi:MAG: helix-turn-helix domain-containing protein [Mariprofundaceae bacterium]|nr:helix-turn-helix domain-containing protein [Mariprofundaceae bacterium]
MPAKAPDIPATVADNLAALGQQIRQHRKAMRISATVAAEAAGMSRATFHRIEKGEPSVTMGAYLNAMAALGIDFGIVEPATVTGKATDDRKDMIPARIHLAEYPQLKKLAWQVHGTDALTPVEALSIYERNRRYIDKAALEPHEQQLIDALHIGLEGLDGTVYTPPPSPHCPGAELP